MDIPAGLLPDIWHWGAALIYALLLLLALKSAPWHKIRDNEASHVFFGAIVTVIVLWILRGGIQPGLDYHLLGITALCLMFEWQFALFAGSLVLALTTWQGQAGWQAFGINALLMTGIPVLLTRGLLFISQRRLPHNFFIYIFINAFLAGALSMLLVCLGSATVQHLAGVHSQGVITNDFLLILPMLMFGEGFMNGAAMSLVVAFKPQWVATFHDSWYLQGK
ncbi:MAG: energy-coupling factor ABC transporter permease [Gammaproteobacteria bacterium]|jgi:uncharacterized membrane protein